MASSDRMREAKGLLKFEIYIGRAFIDARRFREVLE